MSAVFSAIFAGLAAFLLAPASGETRIRQCQARRGRSLNMRLVGLVAVNLIVFLLAPKAVYWALILSVAYTCFTWVLALNRQATRRRAASKQVLHGCNVLVGQLKTGTIPARAIRVAAQECPQLESIVLAQAVGANVADAMRRAAECDGAKGFARLAGAWQLCQRTGAPVAPAVEQVVAGLRRTERTNQTVATELSSAKATGRLLACLPVVGLAFGFAAGGNPIKFLAGITAGNVCLTLSVLLACAGVVWTEKLAMGVERRANS